MPTFLEAAHTRYMSRARRTHVVVPTECRFRSLRILIYRRSRLVAAVALAWASRAEEGEQHAMSRPSRSTATS